MSNQTDDPRLEKPARAIAQAFRSRALSWRLQDDDETLVVVLARGPKVRGTAAGEPDPTMLAELVKPEPARDIDLADGVDPAEASIAGRALAKAPRKTGAGSRRSKSKSPPPPDDGAVG